MVFFADHLAHSIQLDAITKVVERGTLQVVGHLDDDCVVEAPGPPDWAVPVLSTASGYVQTVHVEALLPLAVQHGVHIRLRQRVGEHLVARTPLAWVWRTSPADPPPDPRAFRAALDAAVRVGFERTLEQDAAFGIRQLVDIACKALSPAVNDPYTAVQAIDHLSVIFSELAVRPLGPRVLCGPAGRGVVVLPARTFEQYLSTMCGLVRRQGVREPTVALALLHLLDNCAFLVRDDPARAAGGGRAGGARPGCGGRPDSAGRRPGRRPRRGCRRAPPRRRALIQALDQPSCLPLDPADRWLGVGYASGFSQRISGKRAKSLSAEATGMPCSTASAARLRVGHEVPRSPAGTRRAG